MDRLTWLQQQRRETEEKYTTIWAPEYSEKWGQYPNATHQQFIQTFLSLTPQPGVLLDAACGAGRYEPLLCEKGHTVTGIDQSEGMLAKARRRFPEVQYHKVGLQEMDFTAAFDGAICMDAMENVCPEDWPRVLSNFQRALKSGGYLYFTVEIAAPEDIEKSYQLALEQGLPVIYGEMADEVVYHYYPPIPQVRKWLNEAGFALLEESEGDGYSHILVRKM